MVGDEFGNHAGWSIIEHGSGNQQNAIYEIVYDGHDQPIEIN